MALETRLAVQNVSIGSKQQARPAVRSSAATRPSNLLVWMGSAFIVSLALAVGVVAVRGFNTKSLGLALQLTARWSFLPFWLAYTGGAIAALFKPRLTLLAARGREFGLAYASALLVHLGVVAELFILTSHPPLAGWLLVFFLTAAFLTCLLTLFSFGGLAKALGPSGWYALRVVGLNFILCAFALDFLRGAMHSPAHYGLLRFIAYAPFAAMSVAAPALVFAAGVRRRREKSQRHPNPRLEPVTN